MSNQLTTFNFEGANVQTITDEKGGLWFVAKDVAAIFGYSDTQAMTRRLDDDELESYTDNSSGQVRKVSIINESGLYNSISGSTKPEAKKFKKWVNSEVLPSIRKTGSYSVQPVRQLTANEILAQSALALVEHDKRIAATENEVRQVAVKAEQTASRLEEISVDLRNGVPHGFISRKNAKSLYAKGLSKAVFEDAMTALKVQTQVYISYGDGHSTPTFAYQEDQIPTAIAHFIRDLEQKTSCQCFSRVLNKRVNYVKIPNYGLKGGAAKGVSNHA